MAGPTPESITPKRIPLRTFFKLALVGAPALAVVATGLELPDPVSAQGSTQPHDWFDFFQKEDGTVLGLGNDEARKAAANGLPPTINDFLGELSKDTSGHALLGDTARTRCANDLKMAYAGHLTGEGHDIIARPDQIVLEVSPDMTPGCYDDPKISGRASGAAWKYYTKPEVVLQNAETAGRYIIGAVGLGIVAALGRGVFRWVMNGLASERDADAVRSTGSAPSKTEQLRALSPWNQAPTPASVPVTPTQENPWEKRWAEQERKDKAARRFRVEDYWGATDEIIVEGMKRLSSLGRGSAFETGLGIFWGPKHANVAPLYDEIGDLPNIEISQGPKMPKGNKHKSRKSDWKVTGRLLSPPKAQLPEHVTEGKFREISRKD